MENLFSSHIKIVIVKIVLVLIVMMLIIAERLQTNLIKSRVSFQNLINLNFCYIDPIIGT